MLILFPALARAQAVTAAWDPSPDQVTSYEVCVGTSSLSCNTRLATVSGSETTYRFTPTAGVLNYVAVRAVNSSGRSPFSREESFSIPSISALANRSTVVNVPISPLSLAVSDPDRSSLTFMHTGLPLGLAMNSSTGQISGTPTNAGTYNVTVFANDGLVTASRSFVWTVTAPLVADTSSPTLVITSHASGLVVTDPSQLILGTATDNGRGSNGVAFVRVNGMSAGGPASGSSLVDWRRRITLNPGNNTVTVETSDNIGNTQMYQITLVLAAASAPSSPPLALGSINSSVTSPQAAGNTVTFTAVASGGRSPYQFKWWLYDGANWSVLRDWATSATYAWTPTTPNSAYRIRVWARDSTTSADVGDVNLSVPFVISGSSTPSSAPANGPQLTSLTTNVPSPQPTGTTIRFRAEAAGGTGTYQFKWWLYDGSTWIVIRDWSSVARHAWTPTVAGTGYRMAVWVRDATSMTDVGTFNNAVPFVVGGSGTSSPTPTPTPAPAPAPAPAPTNPLRITAITTNVPSPQPIGGTIRFKAEATGGSGSYQYKWLLYNGSSWIVVRDWSHLVRYAWTPTTAGTNYRVAVWVRESTNTADVSNVSMSVPFTVTR